MVVAPTANGEATGRHLSPAAEGDDMTKVLTPPIGTRIETAGRRPKGRFIVTALLVGGLMGGGIFAATRPTAAELAEAARQADAARWEAVVDYHTNRQQVINSARTPEEAAEAHWQAVVEYYQRQWATRSG
jgi:hypothetical protein